MISRLSLAVALISAVGMITFGSFAPWGATRAVADPGGDRLGCGTYCQNAGGYGGAGGADRPPPAVTLVPTGTVTADTDGYAPVTVMCHRPVTCRGVLLLQGGGRSDLLVDGGATRTIGVPLAPQTIASLRSNGPTPLNVTIDAGQAPDGGHIMVGANGADPWGFSPTILSNSLTVAPPG
jgi:hypothetical protein